MKLKWPRVLKPRLPASSRKAKSARMIWEAKIPPSMWPKPSPSTPVHNQRFSRRSLTEMEIIYTEVALEDLRRIPKRFAAQIVAKISRLEHGLRGNIKRLTNFDCDYRLRCGDYRVLFDVEGDQVLVHRVLHRKEAYD